MRNTIIFADTSIGMTDKVKERVKLIPQYYYFEEDKVYTEINGLTKEEFYKQLEEKRAYTAGCNPSETEELFRQELEKGNDIICLAMSSKLSSTYNTLRMVAEDLQDEYLDNKIVVVDTRSTSLGISFLAEKAMELIDANLEINNIANELAQLIEKIHVYFIVDDLKYLARGGRINPSIAKVGDVLNIKPILYINDGKIEVHHKARGLKGAMKHLDSAVKSRAISKIGIVKLNNENLYSEMRNKVDTNYHVDLGLVLASHLGPNAIATVVMSE